MVFTVFIGEIGLRWRASDYTDIFINQRIECNLHNAINLRLLTQHIMPCYTHKMAIVSWSYILWRHFTLCIAYNAHLLHEQLSEMIVFDNRRGSGVLGVRCSKQMEYNDEADDMWLRPAYMSDVACAAVIWAVTGVTACGQSLRAVAVPSTL